MVASYVGGIKRRITVQASSRQKGDFIQRLDSSYREPPEFKFQHCEKIHAGFFRSQVP
jgi:hypothetical protein